MAKNSVADWDTTAANNTDVGGVDISEGCAPANINNAIRTVMAQIKSGVPVKVSSTTDNAVPRFDGTSGEMQGSGVTIDDDNILTSSRYTTTAGGSAGAPVFYISSDADTGFYNISQGVWAWSSDSVKVLEFSSSGLAISGSLNSTGIDDNATAERLEINDATTVVGGAASSYTVHRGVDTGLLILAGGSGVSNGGRVALYGSTHATQAGDYELYSAANRVHFFDASANRHTWYTTGGTPLATLSGSGFGIGTFSNTGSNNGSISTAGLTYSSRTETTAVDQYRFYNPNGQVGGISTSGSATSFNTSSDERLKFNFRDFDSGEIIDGVEVYLFDWNAGGDAYGFKAQQLHSVFPHAVKVGSEAGPGQEGFDPWAVDQSKLVPVLWREVQRLRERLAAAGL